ncbi:MAG: hypothetical protein IMZ64_04390, partial [Bacteroidetes bacterium]|nr:hypothetical protein [Bacteroidota bacterium]
VYIDASAFSSYGEAEKFLSQHRSRLARDILLNTEGLNPHVVSMLASNFHKNVVSIIDYNEATLKKYRDHLVQAKRISEDMVIASKEDLRKAFLYEKPQEVVEVSEVSVKRVSEDQAKRITEQIFHDRAVSDCETRDSILLSKVSPIVAFVQKNLAHGKTAGALKEMVKARYALADIKDAAEALAVTLSKEGLSEGHVEGLVKEGKISLVLGTELKKIGKKFPVKKAHKFEGATEIEKTVGQQGFMYSLEGKRVTDKYESVRFSAVEALKKGFDLKSIRAKMLEKISTEDVDQVLSEAVNLHNALPAGIVANKVKKVPKVAVEEPALKQTLPDPSTIATELRKLEATFEGSMMDEIDIDPSKNYGTVEIEGLFGTGLIKL